MTVCQGLPMKHALAIAAACLVSLSHPAEAEPIVLDYSESSLGFEVQSGERIIAGTFSDWTAEIEFDVENPENSSFSVVVTTADVVVSDALVASILPSPDWLNATAFPMGQFLSESVSRQGEDTYLATGMLTLLGQAHQIDLTIRIDPTAGDLVAEVSGEIDRKDFGIGEGFGPGNCLNNGRSFRPHC